MLHRLNPVFAEAASREGFKVGGNSDIDELSWADPYFPRSKMPENIKKACIEAFDEVAAHYSFPTGLPALCDVIADKMLRQNGMKVNPRTEVMIVPGADNGLFFAMMPFISDGDEVLIPDPSYGGNTANTKLLKGVPVPVPLKDDCDYCLDMEKFEELVTDKTKLIVLTNPNNPTGRCYSRQELEDLAAFAIKHDLSVVIDQAFEDCVFSGSEMVTLASLEGMHERCVTVCSMSKGYGLCGFRVAYIVTNEVYARGLMSYIVNVAGAPNTAAQYGAIEALKTGIVADENRLAFERRTKKTREILSDVKSIRVNNPNAGFYLWVDVSSLGEGPDVIKFLREDGRVGVSPGIMFGEKYKNHIRIITASLADENKFYEAIYRLRNSMLKLEGMKK